MGMNMTKTPEQMAEEYCEDHDECEFARDAFLAGYQAAELKAKIEFAAKYDHKSPLQVIAAEYVKRRGTIGPLALLEENRFIDGYEAGLHASQSQWISVKERLPEDEVDVVIGWFQKTASNKTFWTVDAAQLTNKVFSGWRVYSEVTHWMPLPKPPKEEK